MTLDTTRPSISQLLMDSGVLSLRSRKGFLVLLGSIRLVVITTILITMIRQGQLDTVGITVISVYLLLAVVFLWQSLFIEKATASLCFHSFYILIDTVAISYFLFRRGNLNSEFYILYLLPLIITAHFLPRWPSFITFGLILVLYGATLVSMRYDNNHELTLKIIWNELVWIWFARSIFLAASTTLYRIQRNLPSPSDSKVVAPSVVVGQLENLLDELKHFVPYDTTSLQLLYNKRLLIVVARGFKNEAERHIYRVDFPSDDPAFPNYYVVSGRTGFIADTTQFPSFLEGAYYADHIKTWMGIPLLSPGTHEFLGLLSVDSSKRNAYTSSDVRKATMFAQKIAALLIEATLGPAALTQASRRIEIREITELWKKRLADVEVKCKDDSQAARSITKIARDVFNVESCSLFLHQPASVEGGREVAVVHLVGSTGIDRHNYEQHESRVSGKPGVGLTSYAVFKERTVNFSSVEIKRTPYRGRFDEDDLQYLSSKRLKQVMIVPIRNFSREVIGALRIENKAGTVAENGFSYLEQNLFENFTHVVGMIIEGIRLRNFTERQQRDIHNLQSVFENYIARPIEELNSNIQGGMEIAADDIGQLKMGSEKLTHELITIMANKTSRPDLETDGLYSALKRYIAFLQEGIPDYRVKVVFHPTTVAEDMPYNVKTAFFDIGREAIMNALRHSRVAEKADGKIEVSFTRDRSHGAHVFTLIVSDNGTGFSMKGLAKGNISRDNYGLPDLLKRQKKTLKSTSPSADVSIESERGRGTTVKAVWTAER